jgi:large subunit ribosomal protein L10
VKVVKNTLTRLALGDGPYKSLAEVLTGSTALIWTEQDAIASAKIIEAFAKGKENFAVKGGVFDGAVISPEEVKALASLPSREELLGKLLALINAPATRLLQTINAPGTNLVRLLEAWRAKQEKGE